MIGEFALLPLQQRSYYTLYRKVADNWCHHPIKKRKLTQAENMVRGAGVTKFPVHRPVTETGSRHLPLSAAAMTITGEN